MPYSSKAQQAYFNTHRKELGNKVVDEFNSASKGQTFLPEHVKPKLKDKVKYILKDWQ
jgi:hypothetical protein